jgi:tape measure domain-containing protein
MADTNLRVRISADLAEIRQGLGLLRGELAKLKQQSASALSGQGNAFADGMKRARTELKAFAATYVSLQGIRVLATIADEATQLRGRLREAKGDYAAILALAQRTRTGLSSTVDLYARLERSTRGRIKDTQQLLGLTESVNQAVKLSFTSQAGGDAALFQLGQALSSGVLRGEELNSVMEQTPRLAQAIADGMNVPIGKLREMAKEGKLTSEVVIAALQSQAGVLAAEYERLPQSISGAWTQLRNSVVDYVGEADAATGVSRSVADAIGLLARNLGTVISVLVKAATLWAAHALLFRALPALYTAAAGALAAYKAQVIATTVAHELGIVAATTWATRLKAAAGIVLAAFTGWQIGSFLREQFEEVELAGIALASGMHAIAVQIRGFFENLGVRIKLAMADALNGVLGIVGRMNSAIVGVLSKLPGPLGAAYAKIGQHSQRFLTGLKLDTRAMSAEVSAANQRLAKDVAQVRAGYAALADAAIARRNAAKAAGGGGGGEAAFTPPTPQEDPATPEGETARNGPGGVAALEAAKEQGKATADVLALALDQADRNLAALALRFEDGMLSIADYFQQRAALEQEVIDLKLLQLQAELETATSLDQQVRALTEIEKLQRDRAEIGPRAAREQAKAEKEAAQAAQRALEEANAGQIEAANQVRNLGFESIRGFFTDMINGAKSFKDAFKDMVRNFAAGLAQMAAEALAKNIAGLLFGNGKNAGSGGSNGGGLLAGFVNFLGGLFGGGSANGNVFARSGQLRAFAKGGAFAAGLGAITAFASGGAFTNQLFSDPTLFTFGSGGQFGVMGEAGPEAVMPLTRGPGGRLGVDAHGGAGGRPKVTAILAMGDRAVADAIAGAAGEEVVLTHVMNNIDRIRGA